MSDTNSNRAYKYILNIRHGAHVCPDCGAIVENRTDHDRWHARIDMALAAGPAGAAAEKL